MKIREALRIGLESELSTVDEAVRNIEIHAGNFFVYTEMRAELKELYESWDNIDCPKSMSIEDALKKCEDKLKESTNGKSR